MLWIVTVAWVFVVGIVALVEVVSPRGSLMGALGTLVFFALLPLALLLWLTGASLRRRRLRAAAAPSSARSVANPDRGRHAAGGAVAPEREEG